MRTLLAAVSILALTACGLEGTDGQDSEATETASTNSDDYGYQTYSDDNLADSMASNDEASMRGDSVQRDSEGVSEDASNLGADETIADSEERPIMQVQVVLDRQGFGPGVIDGKMGMSTENALRGFQEANELDITGKHDEATKKALADFDKIPATRVVTVPKEWGELEFVDMPSGTAEKAEMERLGYTSLDEKLAERFHTTVAVLKELNPGGKPAGMDGSADTRSAAQMQTQAIRTKSRVLLRCRAEDSRAEHRRRPHCSGFGSGPRMAADARQSRCRYRAAAG